MTWDPGSDINIQDPQHWKLHSSPDSYNYLSVQYNMEDAEEYQCAIRLEKFFEKEVKKLGLSEEPAAAPKAKRNRRTM
jgi:hypothetical protein